MAIVLPELDTPRVFEFDSVFRPDCSQHLGRASFIARNGGQLKSSQERERCGFPYVNCSGGYSTTVKNSVSDPWQRTFSAFP